MLRARFVVVPLVLLGPFAGYFASLGVSDALDARESRQREREYERRLAPAEEALRTLRIDGMSPCGSLHAGESACLTGTVDVKAAHAAFVAALRDLDATYLTTRCRDLSNRSVCFADALLHGNDVHAMVHHEMVGGKPTRTVRVTVSATPHVDV